MYVGALYLRLLPRQHERWMRSSGVVSEVTRTWTALCKEVYRKVYREEELSATWWDGWGKEWRRGRGGGRTAAGVGEGDGGVVLGGILDSSSISPSLTGGASKSWYVIASKMFRMPVKVRDR